VRATTAFNKMLAIPGATVTGITFSNEGIVVSVRLRAQRLRCRCGWSTRARYDSSPRQWRHLDLGASRLYLRARIRRLACQRCARVVTEDVPWARPGARFTRDFEDVVAWLAQRTDRTSITRLLRCSWESVTAIIERVVAEAINAERLDHVYRIGVDEISYRSGHRYLTVVADHDRAGAVLWAGEGRNAATLAQFYELLGPQRCQRIEAVSMDMAGAYAKATRDHAPHARQCVDPFHVVKLANEALDATRRWCWNNARGGRPKPKAEGKRGWGNPTTKPGTMAHDIKNTRWALLKDPRHLHESQRAALEQLRAQRHVLWRAYLLKEELRDLFRLPDPSLAAERLRLWLSRACRSRIPAMVKLSRTIRLHQTRILDAITLGLSNSKLEGLNSRVRLINHRGYGHHSATAIIALIYLNCGGITVELPTGR